MRRAAINRVLGTLVSQKTVDQSRSKRVSTTDAIEDLQVLARRRWVKLTVRITNGAPVIHGSGLRISERGCDHFEIRKMLPRTFDHAMKVLHFERRMLLVQSFYLKAKTGSEIFFIAQH